MSSIFILQTGAMLNGRTRTDGALSCVSGTLHKPVSSANPPVATYSKLCVKCAVNFIKTISGFVQVVTAKSRKNTGVAVHFSSVWDPLGWGDWGGCVLQDRMDHGQQGQLRTSGHTEHATAVTKRQQSQKVQIPMTCSKF